MRNGECGMDRAIVEPDRRSPGSTHPCNSAFHTPHSAFYIRDLVLPLRNLASTPRAPTSRSSCGVAPATRRAAPAKRLGAAYPRIPTTCLPLLPGLPPNSTAHTVRRRPLLPFRVAGLPPSDSGHGYAA